MSKINICEQVQQNTDRFIRYSIQLYKFNKFLHTMRQSRNSLRNARSHRKGLSLQLNQDPFSFLLPQGAQLDENRFHLHDKWLNHRRPNSGNKKSVDMSVTNVQKHKARRSDYSKSFKLQDTNITNTLDKIDEEVSQFQSSLPMSGKARQSEAYPSRAHCSYSSDKTYLCQICERVRLVCPYSNSIRKVQKSSGVVNRGFAALKPGNHESFNKATSLKTYGNTNCRFCQPNKAVSSYLPSASPAFTQPKIMEQIMFFPVIHNVLQPSPASNKTSPTTNVSFESPGFRNRHQSKNFSEPQSSPIKIEEDVILTPAKIRELTNTMIISQ